jgi:hypothetical protein
MNIFAGLQTASFWVVVEERPFSQNCIDMVEKAEVVNSNYGQSVCFLMKSGDKRYIPIDKDSYRPEGTLVNLNTASVLTLERNEEEKIMRVKIR